MPFSSLQLPPEKMRHNCFVAVVVAVVDDNDVVLVELGTWLNIFSSRTQPHLFIIRIIHQTTNVLPQFSVQHSNISTRFCLCAAVVCFFFLFIVFLFTRYGTFIVCIRYANVPIVPNTAIKQKIFLPNSLLKNVGLYVLRISLIKRFLLLSDV